MPKKYISKNFKNIPHSINYCNGCKMKRQDVNLYTHKKV